MYLTRSKSRALAVGVFITVIMGFAGCVATPPAPPAPAPPSLADYSFEELAQRYLAEVLALTPVVATALGEHRFDSNLDDVSAAGFTHRAALTRELLAQLDLLQIKLLSRAHQVDAHLLRNELEYELWRIERLQEWRWNPLLYTDLVGNSMYTLLARNFAPLPQRLHSLASRMAELPRLLAQVRDSLEPERVPRLHAETAIRQNAGVLILIDRLIVPQLAQLAPAEQGELKAALEHARIALGQHRIWLEKKLLPAARGDLRLGAELYDAKLRFELDSDLTRAQIHERAHAELTRVRAVMYDIAREVLASRSDAPALPASPNDAQQQTAIAAALELAELQHPGRNEIIETAWNAFEEAQRFVRAQDLVTIYDDPFQIIPMPEYQRGVALAYCDAPGPLEKGQKTFFDVAPIPAEWSDAQVNSYLREYNTRALALLTIHEAMPGHYLQLTHANRYASPLRAVLASATFAEGWAVYVQGMMIEQGFLDRDPLLRLIGLKWELRTIANALLDQGVHTEGMTREEALRLMMHDTFQEEREAAAKWVRAQLTATQLSTYFVGLQEHRALREEIHRTWGGNFTLKRYHDAVLSYGSPPIRYVRELMLNLPIE